MSLIIRNGFTNVAESVNFATTPTGDLTLNFSGTYNLDGDLTLATSLLDGATVVGSVSETVAAASVVSGDYFGTFVAKLWGSNAATVVYKDVEISVIPEASTSALLAGFLAFAVLGMRRRRL
jgi:hypothetical protein